MSNHSITHISLRIVILKPIPGILYRLQNGAGNSYTTEQAQLSTDEDLVFTLTLPVKEDRNGHAQVAGPYVQGPPAARFVYIGMGSYAGQQQSLHNGRMKLPLPVLTKEIIGQCSKGLMFSATFPGVHPKTGNPLMATVKPAEGWTLV